MPNKRPSLRLPFLKFLVIAGGGLAVFAFFLYLYGDSSPAKVVLDPNEGGRHQEPGLRDQKSTALVEDASLSPRQPVDGQPSDPEMELGEQGFIVDRTPNLSIRTIDSDSRLPVAAYVEIKNIPFEPGANEERGSVNSQLLQTDQSGTSAIRVSPGRISGTAWTTTLHSSKVEIQLVDSRATSTLEFELSPGGVIEGRVQSSLGDAIEGAEIFVPFINDWNIAISSADGHFRYYGFPTNGSIHLLRARANGHHDGFARIAVGATGKWTIVSDGVSLEERSGGWNTAPYATLSLPLLTSIAGRILSPTGSAVSDAEVIAEGSYITSKSAGATDRDSTLTDIDGFFLLSSLRPGISHSLQVNANGYAQRIDIIESSAAPDMDVGVIVLEREAFVSGKIMELGGEPVHGISVAIIRNGRPSRSFDQRNSVHLTDPEYPGQDARMDSLRYGGKAITGIDGRFRVGGLNVGEYELKVHWNQAAKVHQESIEILRGGMTQRDVVLDGYPAIGGSISISDKVLLTGARLCLYTTSGKELGSIQLHKTGRFRFPALTANNQYELWINLSEGEDLIRSKLGVFYSGQDSLGLAYSSDK